MRTFHLRTFGCQMNEYDSARIRARLQELGFREVDSPDEAEVVLVNTCTVREKAAEKALHLVHHAHKRGKEVVVLGCLAQQMREQLLAHGADFVLGPRSYSILPSLLTGGMGEERVYCGDLDAWDQPEPQALEEGAVSGYVTIMQGCDHFCTFCVVPYTRGREVSRPVEAIVEEALALERRGVLELTLLGQNVNSYQHGPHDFADLLGILDRRTRLLWIKFTSPHPRDMNVKVLDVLARGERLSHWIHLPLQAGSTRILQRMRRGYTKEEFLAQVATIRRILPDVFLTTDIMVGFPGETEEDFEDTLDVVRQVQFDGAYMFIYSPRPGTPAAQWEDQVPEEVKGRRLRRLIDEVNRGILRQRQKLIGQTLEVLVDRTSKKDPGMVSGKTRHHLNVVLPGTYAPGTLVRGRVVEIRGLTPVLEPLDVIPREVLLERLHV